MILSRCTSYKNITTTMVMLDFQEETYFRWTHYISKQLIFYGLFQSLDKDHGTWHEVHMWLFSAINDLQGNFGNEGA